MSRCLLASLLFVAGQAVGQTTSDCLKYALYREARGEGIITQRATLDVIMNRVRKSGKSACKVLRERNQFPYMKRGVKKVVDRHFSARYHMLLRMGRILDSRYLYFNSVRHKWGEDTVKIGGMYYST